MKFVDFGDLVEVTYDDESVELIAKEEAYKLGYKERQQLRITYKGQIYNGDKFAKLIGIDRATVHRLYHLGYVTGEEIERIAQQRKEECQFDIHYENVTYSANTFCKSFRLPQKLVYSMCQKGITDGNLIIEAHKTYMLEIEQRRGPVITYNKQYIRLFDFAKKHGMTNKTAKKYYSRGLRTGEEMLLLRDKKQPKKDKQIPYKGRIYNFKEFTEETGIAYKFIIKHYCDKITTGEELIELYNASKEKTKTIIYQNNVISYKKFSDLTGVALTSVYSYVQKGCKTGEEILALYKPRK